MPSCFSFSSSVWRYFTVSARSCLVSSSCAAEAVAGDDALHIVRQLPQIPPQGGRQLDSPAQGGIRGPDGVLIPAQLIPQGRQSAGHVVEHVLHGLELLLHVPVQLLHPLVDALADA